MNRRLPLMILGSVLLAGCVDTVALPTLDEPLKERLKNPLYAEYYYDDMTEIMTTLVLREDSALDAPGIRDVLDRTRNDSLTRANAANALQLEGTMGTFISEREFVLGDALLLDDVLYLGPTFDSAPGPSLRVYLTTVVDPRDAAFPDPTAVDLGRVKDQYGAQSFVVPPQKVAGTGGTAAPRLRTVVLWDPELQLIYGFVQLSRAVTE